MKMVVNIGISLTLGSIFKALGLDSQLDCKTLIVDCKRKDINCVNGCIIMLKSSFD